EHLGGSGSLLLIQRPIQTALLITAADVADGLCRQRNYTGDAWSGYAFGQLQKRQGAQNNPNLLNPTAEDLGELLLIFLGDLDIQRWTAHSHSMGQNNSTLKWFLSILQAVRDLVLLLVIRIQHETACTRAAQ